jgi:hypothetical protein
VTATVLPMPLLRVRFREARGYLLSGDTTPASLRDTALRFLRGLPPDVRRAIADDASRLDRARGDGGRVGDA